MSRKSSDVDAGLRCLAAALPFVLAVLAGLLASCGQRGMLVPASQAEPAGVRELSVREESGALVVSWRAPEKNRDGSPLIPLRGYRVSRNEDDGRFRNLGFVHAPFPFWDAGPLVYTDESVTVGAPYRYRVIAVNALKGESPPATTGVVSARADRADCGGGGSDGEGASSPQSAAAGAENFPRPQGLRAERGPGGRVYLWWDGSPERFGDGFVFQVSKVGPAGPATMVGTSSNPFFVDPEPGTAVTYRVRIIPRFGTGEDGSPWASADVEGLPEAGGEPPGKNGGE